jgi:transposase
MVGCDLHDKSMLLKIAVGRGQSDLVAWGTASSSRRDMIADLKKRAARFGAGRIVFAYEACGFGFRLHDELTTAGIEAYVLAPSKMERSAKHRKRKTDEKDAQLILNIVRSYVLAGVEMPAVWVPDLQTRDDRELIRRRLAVAENSSKAQVRVRWMLKGQGIESSPFDAWTLGYWQWLEGLLATLPTGASSGLASLMREIQWLQEELGRLDVQVMAMAASPQYSTLVASLRKHKGVGTLTAMVYLSEMGDLRRFTNRQQVGSYLGLTPASFETGETNDRKGHITHQGPARVRKVLCQAVWSRLRVVESERASYERLVQRHPKHKKIAVVARMRTLGIKLWHSGLDAIRASSAAEAVAV